MADLDVAKYLLDKVNEENRNSSLLAPVTFETSTVSDKSHLLSLSIEEKRNRLFDERIAKEQALVEANKNSLVSKLGFDYDSTSGKIVNALAGAASSASRIVGEGFAGPLSISAASLESQIDPRSMEILRKQSSGKQITPEEQAWIATPTTDVSDSLTMSAPSGPTPEQMFKGVLGFENRRNLANKIRSATDIGSIVDSRIVNKANEELVSNPEYIKAKGNLSKAGWSPTEWNPDDVVTLLSNMGSTALNNPSAAVQLIAENVPQIALAIMSPSAMLATNVGYAQSYYDKWSDNFAKRTGKEPTAEEKQAAQVKAWSLAAAETVGELATAGAVKGFKGVLGFGAKAAPEAVKEAAVAASKGLVGRTATSVGRIGTAGAEGALGEMPTEAYQTYVESELEKGKPASFDEVYFGAFAGGLAGGGIATGDKAIIEAVQSSAKTEEAKAAERAKKAVEVAKADTTAYMSNPDPVKKDWVGAAYVLYINSTKFDNTPENAANVLTRVDTEIFQPLVEQIEKLKTKTTEGRKAAIEAKINEIKQTVSTDSTPAELATVKEQVTRLREAANVAIDPKVEKEATIAIKKLEEQLVVVSNIKETINNTVAKTTENDLVTSIDAISKADTVDDAAIQTVIKRAIASPRASTLRVAASLTALADSGKVEDKTATAVRALANGIIAMDKLKSLDDVSSEVLGTLSQEAKSKVKTVLPGVKQYYEQFQTAINGGYKTTATDTYKKLSAFLNTRATNAAALDSMEIGQVLIPDTQGGWKIEPAGTQPQGVGFNTMGSTKGAKKSAAKINSDLSIAFPILDSMALRLGLPIDSRAVSTDSSTTTDIDNVKETTETQQASQKRQEVSGAAAENATTSSTDETTTKQVNVPTTVEELVTLADEVGIFEESLEEVLNAAEISESVTGRVESPATGPATGQADKIDSRQDNLDDEVKEVSSKPENSEPSGETVGTKETVGVSDQQVTNEETALRTAVDIRKELKRWNSVLAKYESFLKCVS